MGLAGDLFQAGYVVLSISKRRTICARLNKCRRQLAKAKGLPYTPYTCGSIFSSNPDPLLDPLSSEKVGGQRRRRQTNNRKRKRGTVKKSKDSL